MRTFLRRAFYKVIGLNPLVDRWVRYRNPRRYWIQRGGDRYFEEQEAVADRTERSRFIAQGIARLEYGSLLEVGCGYGKQLANLEESKDTRLAGIDFSRPQLAKARQQLESDCLLTEADASDLPFQDKSFDVVLSSAVILHNRYHKAQRILSEMIRVSRRYLVHNEDMDVTFSRFGYDMNKTYERLHFRILACLPIPSAPDPSKTQFVIVEIPADFKPLSPEAIPLQYH